ncbi:lipocalin family protein [Gloeocapsa sp. PCC 73106]|uniref:lipocalin family protein n=1 Tax=Gloeocapsa sp. PCC 73106 TaxID=102232 RepID=UPI001EE66BA2|nr:lipocalin family protein [Gloeocapsa sp. PCC 73106]
MTLPPVETVDFVDLERYDGLWYEVARTPNIFQVGCSCVTATYEVIDDSSISIFNSCNRGGPRGPQITIDGVGVVTNPETNAELEIFFEGSNFGEEYWILDLVEDPADPEGDYTYAVIGDSDRDFLFIIARTPIADPEVLEDIYAGLEAQFYDTDRLITSRQYPRLCGCSDTSDLSMALGKTEKYEQLLDIFPELSSASVTDSLKTAEAFII